MLKTTIKLPEIKLVGIKARSNNEDEMNPEKAKISPTVQNYFHNGLAQQIANRKKPNVTYCVFTDYESDHTGEYTYFIGEEVADFENVPEGMEQLTIPVQEYTKFTNGPGMMPDVLINAWKKIWVMNDEELGGKRAYKSDFEIYDERAMDHDNVVFDLYIGLDK
jgi:predicted transcriptional regulator YdeE